MSSCVLRAEVCPEFVAFDWLTRVRGIKSVHVSCRRREPCASAQEAWVRSTAIRITGPLGALRVLEVIGIVGADLVETAKDDGTPAFSIYKIHCESEQGI
jgi:hypothetical protein